MTGNNVEAPRIRSELAQSIEITPIPGLSKAEATQLHAVKRVISGFEQLRKAAGTDGIKWTYFYDVTNSDERQGTLYVPFGDQRNGLLAVTCQGDIDNLTFTRACAFWKDKDGKNHGIIITSGENYGLPSNGVFFYEGADGENPTLYRCGNEHDWYSIDKMADLRPNDHLVLDYYGPNPMLIIDEMNGLGNLRLNYSINIVTFFFH